MFGQKSSFKFAKSFNHRKDVILNLQIALIVLLVEPSILTIN